MNNVLDIIKKRRSTRNFLPEQIDDVELNAILEAACFAPSAHNMQSWYFIAIQNKDLLDELSYEAKSAAKILGNESIRNMAIREKFHVFYNAPTAIIVCGQESDMQNEIDCAAATQNILIAAESLSIGSCWIGFINFLFRDIHKNDYKKFQEILKIPNGYKPYYAVSLGYSKNTGLKAPQRKDNFCHIIKEKYGMGDYDNVN